jgi:hypothetical protein
MGMNRSKTYAGIVLLIILCSVVVVYPLPLSATLSSLNDDISDVSLPSEERQLHLLRVEHYLELQSSVDIGEPFHVLYAFPPDYQYQVPLLLEIFDDTTADVSGYRIQDDIKEPNKLINFTVRSMSKDDHPLLHFTCWVLVKNHDYSDLPVYVSFPKKNELPEETRIWLEPSHVVQSESFLIKLKARQLRGLSSNLLRYAGTVAPYIKEHHYLLFLAELYLGLFLSQDAITTLFINGENVGRSHLACALMRTFNVPCRVLLVNNDQGFWTQMHYMAEYYCPGYGWVLIETTRGESPYETKRQVVNRVCYPADEEDTKRDYIFPYMTGEERWIWIDNEQISPYYVDCDTGSKSQMFSEGVLTTDAFTGNYAFRLTQNVFHQYQIYLGMNLSGENQQHQENAISYQQQGITELKTTQDIDNYIFYLDKAFDEYKEINIS